MSEDRDLNSVVVSADGITVEKRFDREEFAVPAVTFTIRSEHDEPASVRLIDDVPEDFPMDSVGFHPEYENDNWTAYKDHRVEYEREFGPGEEVVTVYGVRLSESDRVEDFLGEPELAEVSVGTDETPPDPLASLAGESETPMDGNTITDIVSEEGNEIVREMIAGERDTLPGLDDEPTKPTAEASAETDPHADVAAAGSVGDAVESTTGVDPLADESNESGDGTDPLGEAIPDPLEDSDSLADHEVEETVEDEPTVESIGEDESVTESADVAVESTPAEESDENETELLTAEPDLPSTGDVAATLAEEIRQGSVSSADLSLLRQELDATLPESTNVRIRHLQSRVEDLAAYTEALEEFIDENGTASEFLEQFESFETEVDRLGEDLDDLEAEVDDVQSAEADHEAIDELKASVETLREDQAETQDRVATLESEVEVVSSNLEETQGRLDDVQDGLDDLQELEAELASIREDLDGVADLDERLEEIDRTRTEVASVRTGFEELEELVGANTQDITAVQSNLSNVEGELAGVTDSETDVESLDERVQELSETVASTEETVESAVSALEANVESINNDIEELRTWRDQLKGVFAMGED